LRLLVLRLLLTVNDPIHVDLADQDATTNANGRENSGFDVGVEASFRDAKNFGRFGHTYAQGRHDSVKSCCVLGETECAAPATSPQQRA
jgi:hypothetical protein